MRNTVLSIAIAAALSGSAFAAPHTIEAPSRMMVLPFRPIGDVGSYGWIGDGVEQSLIVRASQPGSTILTAPPQTVNLNVPLDPVATAKAAGASSVVSGSFQILNTDVKFNGQILDVGTGQVIGSMSATGPVRDLFKLEDDLAQQLDKVLPKQPMTDGTVEPAPVAGMIDTYQPVYTPVSAGSYYSTPDDNYYPRYYSPYQGAGYIDYGYDDYGALPFYSGFYFGSAFGYGYGYGYGDRFGHYHGWEGNHFADHGNYGHNGGHDGGYAGTHGYGGSYTHGWNGGVRGFAPVGTTVGGYNHYNGGVVAGTRGFAVSHGGYQAPQSFGSAPSIGSGYGGGGSFAGSGPSSGGFSGGGSFAGHGGGGMSGGFAGGGHGGMGGGGGGHR